MPPVNGQYQIVINWDEAALWNPLLRSDPTRSADAEAIVTTLHEIVDAHASVGVDILVHCLFAGMQTIIPDCRSAQTLRTKPFELLTILDDAGIDLIDTIMARCRKHNIAFFAGVRMNDRHMGSGATLAYRPPVQEMIDAHPECELKEFPGALDYKYPYVRDAHLAFVAETLSRYDVDGLEYDWPRWFHVFKASEAAGNARHLTDFMRRTRELLDAAARDRNRGRLPLGVRIAQTMDECVNLGYDVGAWVREGLVDYLCPSDFFFTDFNSPTEDFVALTEGTDCKVYPSIHPGISWHNPKGLMGLEEYRAAARNFYAFGAHGVSPYNYQYHWGGMFSPGYPGPAEMWPKAMSFLTELKSDESIARGDRRYLFHPLWSGDTEGQSPTWAYKNDRITLDRSADDPHGTYSFRMAEDLSDKTLSASLEFKVTYMIEGDELELRINGDVIPLRKIETEWRVGQDADHGRSLGPYFHFRVQLDAPPTKFGDNELSLRLVNRVGMARRMLNAQEFEVRVVVSM